MQREELEHIIRACAAVTGDTDFVVIGSQAILGPHPDAPRIMLVSNEADVYPRDHRDSSLLIAANLGELSLFHDTHGIYAHQVGPETATAPSGWEERLIPVSTPNTVGTRA